MMHYMDELINNNKQIKVTISSIYGFSEKHKYSLLSFDADKRSSELLLTSEFFVKTFEEEAMGETVLSEEHYFIITFDYEDAEEVLTILRTICGEYYMTTYYWDLKNVLKRFQDIISPSKALPIVDINDEIPF